jgi:hypothetical protein
MSTAAAAQVKERPMIFSGHSVRAILAGTKLANPARYHATAGAQANTPVSRQDHLRRRTPDVVLEAPRPGEHLGFPKQ